MRMKQMGAPIYEAILQHARKQPLSMHVPGHKNGTVFPSIGEKFRDVLSLDLTELRGLDDLHAPNGVIEKAEQLLSEYYQSEQSWLLVGGSTVGNLAMICAACHPGDRVLVQRNSHRSVLNGIRLAGAHPVFLGPEVDEKSGLATAPSEETVALALKKYPDAKALLLTNPNYYGQTVHLQPLVSVAHTYGIPVLVDEAHGAHFALGPPFPADALQCGADAVVQSAHKTLPAMTMGAFLHVQGKRIHGEEIAHWLRLFQSSSPSYPIMASLDLARYFISQLTQADIEAIIRDGDRIRASLQSIKGLSIVEQSDSNAYACIDPLKVTLQLDGTLNGFEWARALENEGVYPELADPHHVLLILPLARFEGSKLIKAVEKSIHVIKPAEQSFELNFLGFPRLSCPERFNNRETTKVPLDQAAGAVSAQEVTPYPPGVPLILQGERITEAEIKALRHWHQAGGRFQSGHDVVHKGIDVFIDLKSS
ncbi:MAG TPA: aminotransferase class I/II-fold pyridoxal phosphate-dependent enzyme [Bacillales bacterium]|nr:aminotransferase class I/II-fold pyridoxal phosphate-dependent enzyme [Bacillales bacterium]